MSAWLYFWALYSVPLIYVSVFVPVSYCFDYCDFAVQSEVRDCYTSPVALLFFLKIFLAFQGLLWLHTNFKIICSSSVKNAIVFLIGIALNLQIAMGSMIILTILILPIHEYSISFYLFVSSTFSFISVLQFSKCKSFISLGRSIPMCIILFF